MNWRGKPLVSHQVIVQLIGATTTETGLKVCCEIDAYIYPKGVKVSGLEMQAINITQDESIANGTIPCRQRATVLKQLLLGGPLQPFARRSGEHLIESDWTLLTTARTLSAG
jgi:hypothetical protein